MVVCACRHLQRVLCKLPKCQLGSSPSTEAPCVQGAQRPALEAAPLPRIYRGPLCKNCKSPSLPSFDDKTNFGVNQLCSRSPTRTFTGPSGNGPQASCAAQGTLVARSGTRRGDSGTAVRPRLGICPGSPGSHPRRPSGGRRRWEAVREYRCQHPRLHCYGNGQLFLHHPEGNDVKFDCKFG